MPQSFHVLRCYKCLTFQVDIVKKSNKWKCKVCGDKQSIKKVFFTGTGSDCRSAVQQLNLQRGLAAQFVEHAALNELNHPRDCLNHIGKFNHLLDDVNHPMDGGLHPTRQISVDDQDWFQSQPRPFQHWDGPAEIPSPEQPPASRWEAFLHPKQCSEVLSMTGESIRQTRSCKQFQPREDLVLPASFNQIHQKEDLITRESLSRVQPRKDFLPPESFSQVQPREAFLPLTTNYFYNTFQKSPFSTGDSFGQVEEQKTFLQSNLFSSISTPRAPFQLSESTQRLLNNKQSYKLQPHCQTPYPKFEMPIKSKLANSKPDEPVPNTKPPMPITTDSTQRSLQIIRTGSLDSNSTQPPIQTLSLLHSTSTPDPSPPSKDSTPNVSPIEQTCEATFTPNTLMVGSQQHSESLSATSIPSFSRWAKYLPKTSED